MARLDDGHGTRLSFSAYPNVKLWEKEVTPPGMDGEAQMTPRRCLMRRGAPGLLRN